MQVKNIIPVSSDDEETILSKSYTLIIILLLGCRIDFKIATLTDKTVHLKQPLCLAQHLKLKSMHLNTRNNDQLRLQHPSVGTNSYGRRAFSYTAPTVWNKLPYKIRNAPSVTVFRKKLKTLYFKTCSRTARW